MNPPHSVSRDRSHGDLQRRSLAFRLETLLLQGSDRLNPILVKEARQALQSRQFLITFTLLLVFGWSWSILGIALLSPGVYFAPGGAFMLVGYVLILAAPTLIVVPFSAFRSLAAECEDGTFELLSITTLRSRQIVTGKLGSAILQMLVFYSALAPCIAFTYLLRGVDIFTIAFVLVTTFLISVLLSAAGLVIATIATFRNVQALLSVILLIGLLWAAFVWLVTMSQLIGGAEQVPYDSRFFWVVVLAIFSFYVSFLLLFTHAAAARLSFASDNRSTPLRVILFAQQFLWLGWMTYAWLHAESVEVLVAAAAIAAVFWFFVGSLMIGEHARLSPRVKRALPQSFLGRSAFTWFNPGSGTGYTFSVTNLAAVMLTVAVVGLVGEAVGFRGAGRNLSWLTFCGLAACYVVMYLGLARFTVLLLRRFVPTGIFLSFLVSFGLAFLGAIVPPLVQAWSQGYGRLEYGPLQVTNWAWTLVHAAEGKLWSYPTVPGLTGLGAVSVFLFNLLFTMTEVEQVRQETPLRVLEDEARRLPAKKKRHGVFPATEASISGQGMDSGGRRREGGVTGSGS